MDLTYTSRQQRLREELRGYFARLMTPERRALQRNEAAITYWKRHRWPHMKKGRKVWRPSRVRG